MSINVFEHNFHKKKYDNVYREINVLKNTDRIILTFGTFGAKFELDKNGKFITLDTLHENLLHMKQI